MTIASYYKYALLSTAAYVRTGGSIAFADFIREASDAEENRLPLSISRALFDPNFALEGLMQWHILHYYGSDNANDPIASEDNSGFGATLFSRGNQKVLALRVTLAPEVTEARSMSEELHE